MLGLPDHPTSVPGGMKTMLACSMIFIEGSKGLMKSLGWDLSTRDWRRGVECKGLIFGYRFKLDCTFLYIIVYSIANI